jgi:hypothetical protein
MVMRLRYGPRQYWRWSLCRVGRNAVYAIRLIGNWYYVRRLYVL